MALICVSILPQRYRDSATLAASHAVSQFARSVQPVLDSQAELNMLGELERTTRMIRPDPVFLSSRLPEYIKSDK